jgi:putative glycosyltransferase (TIGR04372 family)
LLGDPLAGYGLAIDAVRNSMIEDVPKKKPAIAHWAVGNPYIEAVLKAPHERPEIEFDGLIQANYDSPSELYRISEGYCYVGQFERACALYPRIVELNQNWIDIFELHARALWALQRYSEAEKLWAKFLDDRRAIRQRIGLPLTFYTIDNVFTSSFGNFSLFYPMDRYGYLSEYDRFYFHPTTKQESAKPDSHEQRNLGNRALRDHVFEHIKNSIPGEISPLLTQDDYVTRLPYYCGIDLNRRPTHHYPAFAQKMLALRRQGTTAQLRFDAEQIDACKRGLARMGVQANRPIVCIHVRESGYWGRFGDRTHSTKNADIRTYIPALRMLTANGYQVVRLGDATMRPIPNIKFVFDYARSECKSDYLDIYLLSHAAFLICTSSGPFAVASIFGTPLLATNWIPVHTLPFSPNDLVLLKKLRNRVTRKQLTFSQLLDLDYGEYSYYNLERQNIEVVDNTPREITAAATEMVERLSAAKSISLGDFRYAAEDSNEQSNNPLYQRFKGKPIISEAPFARGTF